MRRITAFMAGYEANQAKKAVSPACDSNSPVRSLVKVRFVNRHMHLAYYNDQFALKEGDVVYVSGKLAGEPGVVTSVSTKFRIHTNDYERVLARLDLTLHGSFTQVEDKMVSFHTVAVAPDQFDSWVNPPEDPKEKKKREKEQEEEDEVISGEGYTMDINHLESCAEMTDAVAGRAIEYCESGRVRYLCIQNGVGRAYVQGSRWYRVDFRFVDGVMTDIYCDCPCAELCKHEAAVALTLWMLFRQSEFCEVSEFMAMDRNVFWKLASMKKTLEL